MKFVLKVATMSVGMVGRTGMSFVQIAEDLFGEAKTKNAQSRLGTGGPTMSDVGVYPESMQEDWRKSPSGDFVSRQWLLTEYDKRHKGPPGGARKMIEEAPPADVRPVREGHWTAHVLKNANVPWGYDCSECGAWFVIGPDYIGKYHHCPNCGAKMGGSPRE